MKKVLATLCLLLCLAPLARAQADEASARAEIDRLNASVLKLFEERKFEETLEPARRALKLGEKTFGDRDEVVAVSLNNLASAYSAKGEPAKVETLLKYVVETRERTLPAGDPKLVASLHNYACFLRQYGRGEEAAKLEERAFASLPEKAGAEPIKVSSGVALCRAADLKMPEHIDILMRGMAGSGVVRVELVVDEAGKVVSAKALDGPTELRALSTQAASRTRFAPLLIKGKSVGFSTVLTYSHGPLSRVEDIGVRIY